MTDVTAKLAGALGRLIDVSMVAMTDKDFATEQSIAIWNEAIEALRLYDAAKAQPKQAAEPVAWRTFDGEGGYEYRTYVDNENYAADWAQRNPRHVGWVEPLYAAPVAQAEPRKPLMEERAHIKAFKVIADHPEWTVLNSVPVGRELHPFAVAFARAIEAAHGIKDNNHE